MLPLSDLGYLPILRFAQNGGRRLTLFPLVSTNPMISNGISIAYAKSVHCQRQQNVYCFVYCKPFTLLKAAQL
jgi:hypothetical protein